MCIYSNALYTTAGQGHTTKYNRSHETWSLAIFLGPTNQHEKIAMAIQITEITYTYTSRNLELP